MYKKSCQFQIFHPKSLKITNVDLISYFAIFYLKVPSSHPMKPDIKAPSNKMSCTDQDKENDQK